VRGGSCIKSLLLPPPLPEWFWLNAGAIKLHALCHQNKPIQFGLNREMYMLVIEQVVLYTASNYFLAFFLCRETQKKAENAKKTENAKKLETRKGEIAKNTDFFVLHVSAFFYDYAVKTI
jgi:hypothetical protein